MGNHAVPFSNACQGVWDGRRASMVAAIGKQAKKTERFWLISAVFRRRFFKRLLIVLTCYS